MKTLIFTTLIVLCFSKCNTVNTEVKNMNNKSNYSIADSSAKRNKIYDINIRKLTAEKLPVQFSIEKMNYYLLLDSNQNSRTISYFKNDSLKCKMMFNKIQDGFYYYNLFPVDEFGSEISKYYAVKDEEAMLIRNRRFTFEKENNPDLKNKLHLEMVSVYRTDTIFRYIFKRKTYYLNSDCLKATTEAKQLIKEKKYQKLIVAKIIRNDINTLVLKKIIYDDTKKDNQEVNVFDEDTLSNGKRSYNSYDLYALFGE